MQPKLSLLILTTEKRKKWLDRMVFTINWQTAQLANPDDVEVVIICDDGRMTIGEKRNIAMQKANGIAVSYIDEDDFLGDQYIKRGVEFANSGCDCASLIGLYFVNGVFGKPFRHNLSFKEWYEVPEYYARTINHLNFVKRDLVKNYKFEHKDFGEDGTISMIWQKDGIFKTQFEIKEVLYFYFARSIKEDIK